MLNSPRVSTSPDFKRSDKNIRVIKKLSKSQGNKDSNRLGKTEQSFNKKVPNSGNILKGFPAISNNSFSSRFRGVENNYNMLNTTKSSFTGLFEKINCRYSNYTNSNKKPVFDNYDKQKLDYSDDEIIDNFITKYALLYDKKTSLIDEKDVRFLRGVFDSIQKSTFDVNLLLAFQVKRISKMKIPFIELDEVMPKPLNFTDINYNIVKIRALNKLFPLVIIIDVTADAEMRESNTFEFFLNYNDKVPTEILYDTSFEGFKFLIPEKQREKGEDLKKSAFITMLVKVSTDQNAKKIENATVRLSFRIKDIQEAPIKASY